MDEAKYQEGKASYDAGDYRAAAKAFLSAAGTGVHDNGAAYHMAGNALMRLRRYPDAATVYGHALRDEEYDRRGALRVNLGQALCAMGEYARAVDAFEAAVAEPGYETPYKAWQGLAGALLERGNMEGAAAAYRKAAIDPNNPDPGKALVNLGFCLMGLDRPADAVEAYKAAIGIEQYQGQGKALANLGIAYARVGEHEQALRAFEKATQLHGHALTPVAQQAYETAHEATSATTEKVEGWETGDIGQAFGAAPGADGWDTGALAELAGEVGQGQQTGEGVFEETSPEPAAPDADKAASELGFGDAEAVSNFFSMTEDEMRRRDHEERKSRRSDTDVKRSLIRRIAIVATVVLLFAAALGVAFQLGYGWPTQTMVVEGLFDAYRRGDDITPYWVAAPDKDVAKEMAQIPPVKAFAVSDSDQDTWTSAVVVTVTPEKGAALDYRITLTREGVGWKVSGVENDWRSTGG